MELNILIEAYKKDLRPKHITPGEMFALKRVHKILIEAVNDKSEEIFSSDELSLFKAYLLIDLKRLEETVWGYPANPIYQRNLAILEKVKLMIKEKT